MKTYHICISWLPRTVTFMKVAKMTTFTLHLPGRPFAGTHCCRTWHRCGWQWRSFRSRRILYSLLPADGAFFCGALRMLHPGNTFGYALGCKTPYRSQGRRSCGRDRCTAPNHSTAGRTFSPNPVDRLAPIHNCPFFVPPFSGHKNSRRFPDGCCPVYSFEAVLSSSLYRIPEKWKIKWNCVTHRNQKA